MSKRILKCEFSGCKNWWEYRGYGRPPRVCSDHRIADRSKKRRDRYVKGKGKA